MKSMHTRLLLLVLLVCCACSDNIAEEPTPMPFQPQTYDFEAWNEQYPEAGYTELADSCKKTATSSWGACSFAS